MLATAEGDLKLALASSSADSRDSMLAICEVQPGYDCCVQVRARLFMRKRSF